MHAKQDRARSALSWKLICIFGLTACILGSALVTGAHAQSGGQSKQGPDYWQPNWMKPHMWAPHSMRPNTRARMRRHWTFLYVGIPSTYAGARSPLKTTPKVIQQGGTLYTKHCATCHGADGIVEGKTGESLSPSPALLAYLIQHPISVDGYLLWSISDGGGAFGTSMPAFKDKLSRDEIWNIIAYMRAGFPSQGK